MVPTAQGTPGVHTRGRAGGACRGHRRMHGACAGVELERCVLPSEALVAALDSAHRALNDVWRWVVRSGEWGAGSEGWGAASAEWGAGSEVWGVGSK